MFDLCDDWLEVKEEGEEGYYTSLVYLIHSVFEKEVEQL